MKLRVGLVVLATTVLMTMALAQGGQGAGKAGGQGNGQRRGMMGTMGYVEQSWAQLCFGIGISADQISKLKPTFKWGWDNRAAAMKSARETRSFDAAAKTMAQVKSTLDQRIPSVLTAAQKTQWQKWQSEQAAMRNRMGQAGGGGGKGGKK